MNYSKVIKNYILNTLYQILVLIVPLITTPYISRVLGASNVGIYQFTQSVATYFVLISAVGTTLYGQREIAYLQNDIEKRTQTFWEIEIFRSISVLLCTILYIFIFCIHGQYYKMYTILLIEVIANAIDISWLFIGLEDFKVTIIRNSIVRLTGILFVFLFVKTSNDLIIYTYCVTVPILIGNISLWFGLKKYLCKINLNKHDLLQGIKKRLKSVFALFLPQVAINVYTVLDKIMIGIFATDLDQVGYYSQAQKIMQLVLTIVASLGTVMLPAMSSAYAKGNSASMINGIKKSFRFTFFLSSALMFGICSIAYRFVPIFFGNGYDLVFPLIIIISPILLIIGVSNVIGRQFLLPTNQQKQFTISIIAGAGLNLSLNIILIHFWNAIGASIATVFAELTVTLVQCWFVRKQISVGECMKPCLKYIVMGFFMFIIVFIVGIFLPDNSIISLSIMIICGIAVYIAELFVTKDSMAEMAIRILKNRFCR